MLLDALKRRQIELDLSDFEFARRLGISRSLWTMTRNEQMPVRDSLLRGVVQAFPDLQGFVLLHLQTTEDKATEEIREPAEVAS